MNYWLVKTEPNTYSWEDLKNESDKITCWDGVRNYKARNIIRDEIKKDDLVFVYHSVVKPMAIQGIAKVVKESYPDHFAFDTSHKYYDPDSDPSNPRWFMMDIKAVKEFDKPVTLEELKTQTALEKMLLLKRGVRLSVQPVTKSEWDYICKLEKLIDL